MRLMTCHMSKYNLAGQPLLSVRASAHVSPAPRVECCNIWNSYLLLIALRCMHADIRPIDKAYHKTV